MVSRFNEHPGLLRRPQITDWLSFAGAASFSVAALGLVFLLSDPIMAIVPFAMIGALILLWRFPIASVFILFVGAMTIEIYGENFADATTERIFLWRNLSSIGIAPVPVSPAEMLMVAGLSIWFLRSLVTRRLRIRGSALLKHYGFYLLAVLGALLHGIASGGNVTIALWEVRASFYALIVFVLALNLIQTRRHIDMLGWLMIVGIGFKGLQGSWRYLVTYGRNFEGNAILSHDEALFFPAYYVFALLMFVFGASRNQKRTALVLLPWVVLADFANNRRASTGALIVCLIALAFILFRILVEYRLRMVMRIMGMMLLLALYVGAYWNSSSPVAQPVQAIKSIFMPDERDASSNRYRELEDQGIMREIQRTPLLGRGYGIEMPLPLGMADLRSYAPFMLYMPHNTILWVWWRTGLIGFGLFWMAYGFAIIRSCWLARSETDAFIRRWSIFAVAVIIMHLMLSWWDLGLNQYRQPVFVWILLAVPEALRHLNLESATAQEDHAGD